MGKRDVRAIGRRDIEKFLRDVAAGKTAANVKTGKRGRAIVEGGKGTATRTVGLLGGIFSFAEERGIVAANPVHGVNDTRIGGWSDERANVMWAAMISQWLKL